MTNSGGGISSREIESFGAISSIKFDRGWSLNRFGGGRALRHIRRAVNGMKEELLAQIRQCPTLPSLPAIAMEVLGLAQSEEVDIAEIARIISKDPALSSKILRTVNSSFYGRSQSVSQVSHALVILGLQSVKTLVLGFSLVGNLKKQKSKGFNHLDYWRRSIYAATAAKTLAAKTQMLQAEECFLAALLQDIGMLVLNQVLHDSYGAITERAATHREL